MAYKINQPKNVIIKAGATVAGVLEWDPGFAGKWNGRAELAQKFVDSEVLKQSAPYTPFQSGMLQKSGLFGTKIGNGEVVWNAPYARYVYYGKVMVGRAPKTLTDRDLTFHGAPKRGAFWFERLKADRGAIIINGAKRIMGGGL
jgi:hypothetical protein